MTTRFAEDLLDAGETLDGKEYPQDQVPDFSLPSRYEALSKGIQGGMGVVFKVKDTKLKKVRALKVIHPRMLNSAAALDRFRQEVSVAQDLHHNHIVAVYDLGEYHSHEYFTMEWIEGKSLRDLIVERKKTNTPFTLEETLAIISPLCDALAYAHNYTVHRDIKPENILIGGDGVLKLADFGLAKLLSPSGFLESSHQMGTAYYMAPEQKADASLVDHRADIYSIGVILFELLTLDNTIGPYVPSNFNPNVPKEVDSVFSKAVQLKPESRYQSIAEFSSALTGSVMRGGKEAELPKKSEKEEQRNIEKEQPGHVTTTAPAKKRFPVSAMAGAVALGLVIIAMIIYSGTKATVPIKVAPTPAPSGTVSTPEKAQAASPKREEPVPPTPQPKSPPTSANALEKPSPASLRTNETGQKPDDKNRKNTPISQSAKNTRQEPGSARPAPLAKGVTAHEDSPATPSRSSQPQTPATRWWPGSYVFTDQSNGMLVKLEIGRSASELSSKLLQYFAASNYPTGNAPHPTELVSVKTATARTTEDHAYGCAITQLVELTYDFRSLEAGTRSAQVNKTSRGHVCLEREPDTEVALNKAVRNAVTDLRRQIASFR